MPWRCVYDPVTGRAISFGTDVDAPVLPGQAFTIVDGPPSDDFMWSNEERKMVPRPVDPGRDPITKV